MTPGDIDPRRFRDLLGHYASGLTVIAGIAGKTPVGFTCQSFYSVSLDPPLVSFCVNNGSKSWPQLRPAGTFSINLLAADQAEISNGFAKSSGDRWSGIGRSPSPRGNPLIHGALAWFDCTLFAEHAAGDHSIVIGQVQAMSETNEVDPLLFYKGKYRVLEAL
ncbi:flavin reductase family protein [Celeribacter indicus]|uniref:Flavin-dependent reductase n=1 Tax=Celeribacter indicus TaxID=1208324 RepID=A0A0B5E012_9RHOB|nr:flavin reductase family protein [Celeribacter indicus]AJE46720.1 flavin-dependent reductase [Celeribacter indicus]SDX04772.1 NADH-FMN oxidoreductase RutF, flavin reductase (DIM6/NTAB) family [Celeribacter indicus]